MDINNLRSKRFYSEERYHYLENQEKIEAELADFKNEIERKFKKAETKDFKFLRVENDTSMEIDDTPIQM